MTAGDECSVKWEKINQSICHLCVMTYVGGRGREGNEETLSVTGELRDRECVFGPAAQQICLFSTVWHQTHQNAEWLGLLVVQPLK